ncbi:MAG: NADPH-dependent aldehyde reductase Ahr [Terriglobia bacterium]
MSKVKSWVAAKTGARLELQELEAGPLGPDEVEVKVEYCGICHSDFSVWKNEWGNAQYPAVLGHEAIGCVVAVGEHAKGLKIGQRVGVGWTAESCMHCERCLSGHQQLCADSVPTIISHRGGFAETVRSHWAWAVPIPEGVDPASAGPLLCGGMTVFQPFLAYDIKPTSHVGVVGIGGLGHMALKFASTWGCEVTAFTSSPSKADEAKGFGANKVVSSRNPKEIAAAAGTLDLLIVTVNVPLDWEALIATLGLKGRMHVVGVVPEPIPVAAFALITGQREISGSPTGSPVDIATMLDFCARHDIRPETELFPMSQVNEALKHLEDGNARYRIVLEADFN